MKVDSLTVLSDAGGLRARQVSGLRPMIAVDEAQNAPRARRPGACESRLLASRSGMCPAHRFRSSVFVARIHAGPQLILRLLVEHTRMG